jgi:hypothetical protein
MDETRQDQRKKKERSPSYPGVDLPTALERAETLRKKEGRSWVPIDAVLKDWDYSPKSGLGLVVVAALKKFGLLEEQGAGDAREVRLTELARTILLDTREQSPERVKAIREAALLPPIHAELWAECDGQLPSDDNLSYQLRVRKSFTDTAAKAFIRQFRDTLAFAGLVRSDSMSESQADKPKGQQGETPGADPLGSLFSIPPPSKKDMREPRTIPIPLSIDEWATLQAAFPLTEAQWTQMLAVLQAMKPALVAAPEAEKEPNGAC